MREERFISEVLEAGGIIRHDVGLSWEETGEVAAPMNPLVVAGVAAKVGGGARSRDSAFVHSRDGRGVVGEVLKGGVASVMIGAHDVHLT